MALCLTLPWFLCADEEFQWVRADPAEVGISPEKLDQLSRDLAQRKTKAFLVIRHDKVACEWYSPDHGPDRKHGTASLAKAIVGGMALAIALDDGYLTLDDPVAKYVSQWQDDQGKAKITIRHLGSHTSGLDDSRPNEEAPWKAAFWRREDPPNDPFTISRDQTPLLFSPGTGFQYSNPGIAMLTYAIASAMRKSPDANIRNLLRDRVYRSIGIADNEWSIGYGKTFEVDGLPLVAAWGGGSFTAHATARIGRLVLRQGNWQGRQIFTQKTIREITRSAGLPGDCGMGWWTNAGERFPFLPRDAVWGAGAGDEILLVVPSLELIMVRYGNDLAPPAPSQENVGRYLFQPLMEAILPASSGTTDSQPPYPYSPIIVELRWDPPEKIIRLAQGSDNWPVTWADDGQLYTAYGDGWGFDPRVPQKLSLGLAVVEGTPPALRGVNIRSETAEQFGEGARGKKASGILMVDGVLYMLVRNAQNAQLARSYDHGRTWEWANWKFTVSFGCPTFLNFARNYHGARDEFVYIYSPDSDSAYLAADRMVLARVRKDSLWTESAYEYFVQIDCTGKPQWSRDIHQRGGVFVYPGRCGRSGISYNTALKRYFWYQVYPQSDHPGGPRFSGGCGVYDAPEPWGPWTTVFHTDRWDIGPGESGCFPTKWMGVDGTEMWLVFSGEDSFSVRRVKFVLRKAVNHQR
ncbi:MAG: serine hydrolase [Thermogutta sp.]